MPDSARDQWLRLWSLFHDAASCSLEHRAQWLDRACAGDTALRREVESLLAAHERSAELLDGDLIGQVAAGARSAAGTAPSPPLPDLGRRYDVLNFLGRGGMGEVFRALDRLTGRTVAVKRISGGEGTRRTGSEFHDSRIQLELALAQEFRVLSSLRHPNIISVLDYGFDREGAAYLAMPLLEDAETLLQAARKASEDVRIDFLVSILRALEYLHRRGVIHRDLKPSNVLVSDGRLKLLDFGISLHSGLDSPISGRIGTLLYMAPETLAGEEADEATDLWAVGMIAYEIFAGKHPWGELSGRQLLDEAARDLDLASLETTPEIRSVLERLLAPERTERYRRASKALADFCRACGRPIPEDRGAIRDSFLQAARFVGRRGELRQLTGRLSRAMAGEGGAVLVSGESGIGKSRLLEELRTRALIEGVLVAEGQAIREGAGPHHLWRTVVQRLLIELEDSQSEGDGENAGEASGDAPATGGESDDPLDFESLAPLGLDLEGLLGRRLSPPPHVEPQAGRERLWATTEALIRRQRQPVLILLEDLHWVDPESLELLARLIRNAPGHPYLMVGSWRTDSAPPPQQLTALPEPIFETLTLERLPAEQVQELCASILGTEHSSGDLVELLERESEGNALFLVEAVRSLAEQAGDLHRIGDLPVPEHISSGGIRQVLMRRLERLPAEDHDLLRLAAVCGRQLDLELLALLAEDLDLEACLSRATEAAVLEVSQDRWRFHHDALRESLLADLGESERRRLHGRVATALEHLPENASRVAALAYHWSSAEEVEKARRATERAGREALAKGAHHKAIHWLEKSLDLHRRSGITGLPLGALEGSLALANHGLGRLEACYRLLQSALAELGWPLPKSRWRQLASSLALGLRHLKVDGSRPASPEATPPPGAVAHLEASRVAVLLAEMSYFQHAPLAMATAALRGLSLAKQARHPQQVAAAYGCSTVAIGLINPTLAAPYRTRSLRVMSQLEDRRELAYMSITLGGFELGCGHLEAAFEHLERATHLYDEVGDQRRWGQSAGWWAGAALLLGDTGLAKDLGAQAAASGHRRGDPHMIAFGSTYQAEAMIRENAAAEAVPLCRTAIDALSGGIDPSEDKRAKGLLSLALQTLGDPAAGEEIEAALDPLGAVPPRIFHTLAGFAGTALAAVGWLEGSRDSPPRLALARRSLADLEAFARRFPIGRPTFFLARARLHLCQKQARRARRDLRRARSIAQKLGMPWEARLAERLST